MYGETPNFYVAFSSLRYSVLNYAFPAHRLVDSQVAWLNNGVRLMHSLWCYSVNEMP